MKLSTLTRIVFASLTAFTVAHAQAAESEVSALKIHGFVDAQYKWQKSQDNTTGAVINDGALYFSHTTGASELYIDLPFTWSGTTTSNDSAFLIGRTKPQAFIAHTIGTTKLQFGQFDTIYGFELNDSPETTFTTQGLIYNNMLPYTHTGALVTHTLGQFTFRGLTANSYTGKGDTPAQLKGKGEYGAMVNFANETYRACVGYLSGRIVGTADKNRNFTDVMVGATFGPLAIDAEYSVEKIGDNDQGTGMLIIPIYTITPEFAAAFRYETLDKVGATTNKVNQATAGIQYTVNTALRVKADYTAVNTETAAGTKTDDSLFAVAGVYKF